MIPEISEILRMFAAGECTLEQAEQWIGSHIAQAEQRQMLLDHFASSAKIGGDDLNGGALLAVMGASKPGDDLEAADTMQWWADAEARIRYVKAEAMLRARIL